MIGKSLVLYAVAAIGLALSVVPTPAQSYPEKPIKLIVRFPPGGPMDTLARFMARPLSERLGQSIFIENRPGAGATLGTRSVATAEPDGYTLLFGSSGSLAISPALYSNLDYDPIASFTPVATFSTRLRQTGRPVVRVKCDAISSWRSSPSLRHRQQLGFALRSCARCPLVGNYGQCRQSCRRAAIG